MGRRRHARELTLVFFLYALLAVAASWPMVRAFSTFAVGDIRYDQRHALWMMWHVKEALLGRQPFFYADLLYYPHGISILVDGVGPMNGLLALPFWPWGPAATFNGATLLGLTLTGWCMYLLVRFGATSAAVRAPAAPPVFATAAEDDGARVSALRAAAFFAGVVLQWSPMHLAGMQGHVEKAFVGLLPLTVLAGLFAFDPARSRAWWAAPGIVLTLALLHNGNHFMFGTLALAILAVVCAVTRESGRFTIVRPVLWRALAAGVVTLVIVAPLLIKIARVAQDPELETNFAIGSNLFNPDLLHLLTPGLHQAAMGSWFFVDETVRPESQSRWTIFSALNPQRDWQGSGVETAIAIPLSVIALAVVAWRARYAGAGRWGLFAVVFAVLSLGPILRVAGRATFTEFNLPVVLPYAFLTSLPGFNVMRTPGRFMMMGSVPLAVLAAWGLLALMARSPRRARLIAIAATAIVLIECWPRAWPLQALPPVPHFYARLASDPERYAVLDLPMMRWNPDAMSGYMYYQIVHRKGIAWAYVSRTYAKHPVPGLETVYEEAPAANGVITRARLAELGYRYVVWHKRATEIFGRQGPDDVRAHSFQRLPASPDQHPLIRAAFAGDVPIVDDALVTVYQVTP